MKVPAAAPGAKLKMPDERLFRSRSGRSVVGGYAVALHGAVRATVDIDIALTWDLRSLQAAERTLVELGLVSNCP